MEKSIRFAFATTCAMLTVGMPAASAVAQTRFETITTISGAPRPEAQEQRRGGTPSPAPFDEQLLGRSRFTDFETVVEEADEDVPQSTAEQQVTNPRGTPSGDDAQPRPRFGTGPRVPVDGDFTPRRLRVPVDGDFSTEERAAPVDGENDPEADNRLDADRAAFNDPPSGFDPRLFSIEVAPLLSERPRQLFRFEPYTPLGIRMGSFVILPVLETSLLADSNVFEGTPARRDRAIEVLPTVRIVSDWRNHAVEFRASGALSRFQDFDSENANDYALELRGRLDITRRTSIEGLVSRSVTQETRGSIDSGPATADAADVTTDLFAATLNHRFNRLSVQLRGSIEKEDFASVDDAGGVIANDDRDERTRTVALRGAWEFNPSLAVFGEVELNRRSFAAVSSEDGVSRDSDGRRYRAGVSFGSDDATVRGEVSIGYGEQDLDDARLADLKGFLIDANLSWRMSALTTLLFTASTDFEATTTAGSPGSISRTAGIELRHAFTEQVIANAGLSYSIEDFETINVEERELELTSGIEYFMNRNVSLFSRFQHTAFRSNAAGRNYRDNELRVGVRLSR